MPETSESQARVGERGDDDSADGGARWRVVYASVIIFAALVIAALWWFSRAFSS